jgi:DNA-binding CsgD family transcriptional regulator
MSRAQGSYEAALEAATGWHDAADVDALVDRVLHDLLELVEADAAGWNEFDQQRGTFRVVLVPDLPMLDDLRALERHAHQHPLLRSLLADPLSPPVAFSDFLTTQQLHRLDLYREFYGPHGVEYQIAFGVTSERTVGIALNRRSHDFTPAERRFLDMIRRHVTVAYASVVARTEAAGRLAQLERGLAGAGNGFLLVSRGLIVDSTALGRELLETWLGADATSLPAELRGPGDWPRTFERAGARLVVRRVPGRPTALILEQTEPRADPGLVEAYGLTEREVAVLAASALGRTARETAALLQISPRTVEKHLEHVREKLGAASRAAAAERLFGSTP